MNTYWKTLVMIAAASCALVLAGCEVESTTDEEQAKADAEAEAAETSGDQQAPVQEQVQTPAPDPAVTEAPPAEAPPPAEEEQAKSNGADELDISDVQLLGPHKGIKIQRADVTRKMDSADKQGDVVRMSFEDLDWRSTGDRKKIDGRVYIFWREDDEVVGGHFDWHGTGQTVKTLENIPGGYLDGRKPPRGSEIWFCISNLDGDERTNVVKSDTDW